jgi:hypothetical protein
MNVTYFVVGNQLFSIPAPFKPRCSVNKKRFHEEIVNLKKGEEGDISFQKFLGNVVSCESTKDVLHPKISVSDNSLTSEEPSINSIIHEFFSGENHSNSQSIPDDRLTSKKRKFVEIVN